MSESKTIPEITHSEKRQGGPTENVGAGRCIFRELQYGLRMWSWIKESKLEAQPVPDLAKTVTWASNLMGLINM